MAQHIVPKYLISPQHPITINLVGCGGTGSQLLVRLAQIDHALRSGGLGMGPHPGLLVSAWDGDEVSGSNVGRSGFFPADAGINKAVCLITRINRSFGLNWKAKPQMYDESIVEQGDHACNILITCVDSAKARVDISRFQKPYTKPKPSVTFDDRFLDEDDMDEPIGYIEDTHAYLRQYYWMDIGNSRDSGQIVLGTLNPIPQIKEANLVSKLPTIVDLYPDLASLDETDRGPSCSMAEALFHQDLCINSMLAEWGKKIIWSLFKTIRIDNHGVYVNLKTFITNPLPIHDTRRSGKTASSVKSTTKNVRRMDKRRI